MPEWDLDGKDARAVGKKVLSILGVKSCRNADRTLQLQGWGPYVPATLRKKLHKITRDLGVL